MTSPKKKAKKSVSDIDGDTEDDDEDEDPEERADSGEETTSRLQIKGASTQTVLS